VFRVNFLHFQAILIKSLYSLQDAVLKDGEKCVLRAQVSGNPAPKITWFKDGVPVDKNFGYATSYDLDSGLCSLTIDDALVDDSANWSLRASNIAGTA
jgi:titin